MRFSSQGYAKLNEKLAPDMAVLEGGYAIQTALPYVNTGIILAMAGLDYSCVREPDFKPGMFVQAARDRKTLEETVAAQLENWNNRDRLVEAEVAKYGDFYSRRKQIGNGWKLCSKISSRSSDGTHSQSCNIEA